MLKQLPSLMERFDLRCRSDEMGSSNSSVRALAEVRGDSTERPKHFDTRFSRCCTSLRFLARHILGRTEGVERAIENCRKRASQNPPDFETEGAFHSWLFRILIDE